MSVLYPFTQIEGDGAGGDPGAGPFTGRSPLAHTRAMRLKGCKPSTGTPKYALVTIDGGTTKTELAHTRS